MKVNYIDASVHTCSLETLSAGTVFKYPSGSEVYMVCESVGNLKNVYPVGRVSKKRKVWATNLAKGTVAALDYDAQVVECKAELQVVVP